jgi:DNA repair/transcription protein MET18/MMS19
MESNLKSSDPYKRARAVQELVDAMSLETIQKAQSYLEFFLDKLSDQLSVGGALQGILKILQNSSSELRLERISQAILEELNFSAFPQTDRLNILRIYAILSVSMPLSKDYVQGYLHLVQGEKDPRCLLLGLKIIKDIMVHFDCTGLEEDIFDWTFAYFPITFKEKDNDSFDLTQKDLTDALMECITVDLIGMGEFVIPFLTEKMESTRGVTKRDAMIFVGHASKVYHHDLFNKNLQKLWRLAKEEICRPDNQENSMVALVMIKDVLSSLSLVQVYSNDQIVNGWEKMVELIMVEVLDSLESADHNQVVYTEKIFLMLCTTSSNYHILIL